MPPAGCATCSGPSGKGEQPLRIDHFGALGFGPGHAPVQLGDLAGSGALRTMSRRGPGPTGLLVAGSQLGVLSSSTTLVSVTVGGNDVGFADVMQDCVLYSESTCVSSVNAAVSQMRNSLPSGLGSLYSAIRSRAPQAHVVVLGYPRFYQLKGTCIAGLTETERSTINNASDVLNGVIAKQAAHAGFTFSGMADEFTGHELCSGDAWLNSVTLPVYNSYHPKATGQSGGYLPAFRSVA